MLLEGIILTCVKRINEERSISNLYRLLTGNRSIQTIQDAHLYDLNNFYGIDKKLPKSVFNICLQHLIENKYIIQTKETEQLDYVTITKKGHNWLTINGNAIQFHHFQGKEYHETGIIFYERLLLLIQTLTNMKKMNKSFIPVIDKREILHWVKSFYQNVQGKEQTFLAALETELVDILHHLPFETASIFVDRLTAYQHYGKSVEQLALAYKKNKVDIALLLTSTIHFMLTKINNDSEKYPTISKLIVRKTPTMELQQSTKKTYNLFKQGKNPETIANQRQLKLNTIYDHLAEIALYDKEFPFQQFITNEEKHEIMRAMEEVNSYKLKEIKEQVSPEINYFQIRLMFAWIQNFKN